MDAEINIDVNKTLRIEISARQPMYTSLVYSSLTILQFVILIGKRVQNGVNINRLINQEMHFVSLKVVSVSDVTPLDHWLYI